MGLKVLVVLTILIGFEVVTAVQLWSILDTQDVRHDAWLQGRLPIEGQIKFPQLVRGHGLKRAEHTVRTEDGYLLRLFQIPGNPQSREPVPVLLLHGHFCTSDSFIIRGESSIIKGLSKARGRDVWVANLRGNYYSREHVDCNPDTNATYWNFSLDEFGRYDLPAIIDYILAYTQQTSLRVIAHGLGASSFFVMGSTRPEYNKKVDLLIAMAPVVAADDLETSSVYSTASLLQLVLNSLQQDERFGSQTSLMMFFKAYCSIPTDVTYKLCKNIIYALSGGELLEMDQDFLRRLVGHYPAGTSRKSALHYLQIFTSKRFAEFDYGEETNVQIYKTARAPEYDLRKVDIPVVLVFAENDQVVTSGVAETLKNSLPHVVTSFVLTYQDNSSDVSRQAQHMDFLWGDHLYTNLFPNIFELLDQKDYTYERSP